MCHHRFYYISGKLYLWSFLKQSNSICCLQKYEHLYRHLVGVVQNLDSFWAWEGKVAELHLHSDSEWLVMAVDMRVLFCFCIIGGVQLHLGWSVVYHQHKWQHRGMSSISPAIGTTAVGLFSVQGEKGESSFATQGLKGEPGLPGLPGLTGLKVGRSTEAFGPITDSLNTVMWNTYGATRLNSTNQFFMKITVCNIFYRVTKATLDRR